MNNRSVKPSFFPSHLLSFLFVAACAFVGLAMLMSTVASSDEKSAAIVDDICFSMSKIQTPAGVLAAGDDRYCRTSAQAMASVVLLERGHTNRARRILDFFEEISISETEKESGFKGFADFYEIKTRRPLSVGGVGVFTNVAAADGGYYVSHYASAFVAVAALNYRLATGDKRFDSLIDSLGKLYLSRIDRWGLYSGDDGSPLSSNIAAYATFVAASMVYKMSRTEVNFCTKIRSLVAKNKGRGVKPTPAEEEYLRALKRLRFALMDLMYDRQKKLFKGGWSEDIGYAMESEQVFASLILGGIDKFYYNLFSSDIRSAKESVGKEDEQKSSLAVWLSSGNARQSFETYLLSAIESEGQKTGIYLIKAPAGGKFFSRGVGAETYYDLLATAFYVFAITGRNPFEIFWSATESPDGMIAAEFSATEVVQGEKWKIDTFESGEERFYVVESQSLKNTEIPLPPAGIFADSKIKNEGNFSLKIRFITKQSKDEKCQGAVSRVFYPTQDFTGISSVKCWVSARPATFTLGVTNLKIRLRLTDQSGASADSRNLSYSGRGVDNTIIFPSGFTPVSPARLPDYTKIKKISFVFEEDTQTTWDINLDNIRIE